VLETIREEGLLANAAERGRELTSGLRAMQAEDERIGDVRGPGLMIGVEFVTDRESRTPDGDTANAVQARAMELGLLLLTCGPAHETIRWIPPLDATPAEISESLELFGEALRTA
jgi:4-aminobutyrate aminotransferase-like enzyme